MLLGHCPCDRLRVATQREREQGWSRVRTLVLCVRAQGGGCSLAHRLRKRRSPDPSPRSLLGSARLCARRRSVSDTRLILDRTLASTLQHSVRIAPHSSPFPVHSHPIAFPSRAAMSGTSALLALAKQTPYTWTDDKQHIQIGNVTLHRQTKVPYR